MCTRENTVAHILGAPYIDDVMSYNSLNNKVFCLIFVIFFQVVNDAAPFY